jgi:8-oxo-dGTP diphosphatase
VLRPSAEGPEVLVVHRPRYDDWSLPKGKDEPGEPAEDAAIREVREEAGQPVRVIAPLGESAYRTANGDKVVRWFAMRATGPQNFVPNDEVDRIAWLSPGAAAELLSYERDRDLVQAVDPSELLSTSTLFLIRHAAAGDRSSWEGDDRDRPLTSKGIAQSKALVDQLRNRQIEAIFSSPYVRCLQTVRPLAEILGLEVHVEEVLAEGEVGKKARELVKSLAGQNAVVSTHGDVIPALLDWMARRGMALDSAFDCKKGSVWEVDVGGGEFHKAVYVPPPAV